MALIKVGSLNDFVVRTERISEEISAPSGNADILDYMGRSGGSSYSEDIQSLSSEQRGLALKKIQLTKGGLFQKFFKSTSELYFVAWTWDFSGQPINQYPGAGVAAGSVLIPMTVGTIREFIGVGINLFPQRIVSGGIAVRIQVWESDKDIQNFGKAMSETADAIKKSELSNLLAAISLATGGAVASIAVIERASLELAGAIGTILKTNGDDYVDLFEGYYPAPKNWTTGDEKYKGNASVITLNKY